MSYTDEENETGDFRDEIGGVLDENEDEEEEGEGLPEEGDSRFE